MKPNHPARYLLIALFLVVSTVLLFGTLRAFSAAHAAPPPAPALQAVDLTPTPSPTPAPVSTDTTGVIALSIVVVSAILFGILWGGRRPANPPKRSK